MLCQAGVDARDLTGGGVLCGIATESGKRVGNDLVLSPVEEWRQQSLSSAIGRAKSIDDAMTAETRTGTDGRITKATPFALIGGQGLNGPLKTTRYGRARVPAGYN